MTWVKLDDQFYQHPKVLAAGALGLAMQVAGLCYCNRYLTDGFVPRGAVAGLLDLDGLGMRMWSGEFVGGGQDADAALVVEDLLEAGLWDRVDGGFQIHDYFDYQPSRATVEAEKERKREAGRLGGLAKAAKTNADDLATTEASLAGAKGAAKQTLKQNPGKTVARTRTRTRTPTEEIEKSTISSVAAPRRNAQWDALVFVFGYSPASKAEQSLWGKLVKPLNEMDADQDSLVEAARRYKVAMPNVEMTPTALVKHYQRLMASNGSAHLSEVGAQAQRLLGGLA